jgi:sterol desaturase/sphingolipid hydroxylase (fatty acid hydroxylase superfamily)
MVEALPFLKPDTRIYWAYLLASFIIAWLVYRFKFKDFITFCFPKNIYLHKSSKIDYGVFLINHVFSITSIFLSWFNMAFIAFWFHKKLIFFIGPLETKYLWEEGSIISFTLIIVLLKDFAVYIAHVLHHKINFIWAFHRTHHSAEVLNPITLYRVHPVNELISKLIRSTVLGLIYGLIIYLFKSHPSVTLIFGTNAIIWIFNILGSNLRHTHIWISYGYILSHILISPAQHQIHHSKNKVHHNKNYGEIFALWDWIFGTLYIPAKKENINFGLSETSAPHTSYFTFYFEPFKYLFFSIISRAPTTKQSKNIL